MKLILALVCTLGVCSVVSAKQLKEPETPTVQETFNYLQAHLAGSCDVSFDRGSRTKIAFGCNGGNVFFDAMDVSEAWKKSDEPEVHIQCESGKDCVSFFSFSANQVLGPYFDYDGFRCENQSICPNVVRAMNHLIRLIQQQNMPAGDPFAPK